MSRQPSSVKNWIRRNSPVLLSVTGTASPDVVLTFDDGPDPEQTPEILDILDEASWSATFFVLLTRARRNPELVRAVVSRGHEVGLHGVDHQPLTRFSFREALWRTADARAELSKLTGSPVFWFRPPYGAQTPISWLAVRRAGLTPVFWSGTSWDWKDVPPAERVAMAVEGAEPGRILLAHDGIAGPGDGSDDYPPALEDRAAALRTMQERYAELGMSCTSLGVAAGHGPLRRTVEFSGLWR